MVESGQQPEWTILWLPGWFMRSLMVGAYAELERGHLMVGINVGYRAGAVRGPGRHVHVCLERT
jgi:hypothetical protein